jgi:predicted nucleotidyltransferase
MSDEARPQTIEALTAELANIKKSQSGSDRAYQDARRLIQKLEAKLEKYQGYTPEAIDKRLVEIEKGFDEKARLLKLDYYVKKRSLDLGLDEGLFTDMRFADEIEAEAFMGKITKVIETKQRQEILDKLSSGSKPEAARTYQAPTDPHQAMVDRAMKHDNKAAHF